MSKLRQGDILLYNTSDGGEIKNENGEPEMDGGFENAVFLSMFESDGKPHWTDEYKTESAKGKAEFYNFIIGNTKTIGNINHAVLLLEKDLEWIKTDTIADTINIDIEDTDVNRILVSIEILANGETLFENKYEINWGLQKEDPGSGRI
jgi:phage gp46-like protein